MVFARLARVASDIMFNLREMSRSHGPLRVRRPYESIFVIKDE